MAGNIQHIYHTRDLNKIKGVVEIAPVTAALTIIALLALAAFPPFALFISEFLTFVAGIQSGPIWVVVLVAIASPACTLPLPALRSSPSSARRPRA